MVADGEPDAWGNRGFREAQVLEGDLHLAHMKRTVEQRRNQVGDTFGRIDTLVAQRPIAFCLRSLHPYSLIGLTEGGGYLGTTEGHGKR